MLCISLAQHIHDRTSPRRMFRQSRPYKIHYPSILHVKYLLFVLFCKDDLVFDLETTFEWTSVCIVDAFAVLRLEMVRLKERIVLWDLD